LLLKKGKLDESVVDCLSLVVLETLDGSDTLEGYELEGKWNTYIDDALEIELGWDG
jgi:hypothetical protein